MKILRSKLGIPIGCQHTTTGGPAQPLCEMVAGMAVLERSAGNFRHRASVLFSEVAMRAYLYNLPTGIWALAVIPAVLIAYPVGRVVLPALVHAIVPDVVRTVLSLM